LRNITVNTVVKQYTLCAGKDNKAHVSVFGISWDSTQKFCGHVLHNFSENCIKKYYRALLAIQTNANSLKAV
jgi:hypothetical protein